MLKNCSLYTI